jgi:hypothetical protein
LAASGVLRRRSRWRLNEANEGVEGAKGESAASEAIPHLPLLSLSVRPLHRNHRRRGATTHIRPWLSNCGFRDRRGGKPNATLATRPRKGGCWSQAAGGEAQTKGEKETGRLQRVSLPWKRERARGTGGSPCTKTRTHAHADCTMHPPHAECSVRRGGGGGGGVVLHACGARRGVAENVFSRAGRRRARTQHATEEGFRAGREGRVKQDERSAEVAEQPEGKNTICQEISSPMPVRFRGLSAFSRPAPAALSTAARRSSSAQRCARRARPGRAGQVPSCARCGPASSVARGGGGTTPRARDSQRTTCARVPAIARAVQRGARRRRRQGASGRCGAAHA